MDKASVVVVLVCSLSIGGFVNYRRNAAVDAEFAERPYAELHDEDLETLIHAYEDDIQAMQAWVHEEPTADLSSQKFQANDMESKAEAFEDYQREADRWNNQRGALVERETMLEELRWEQQVRSQGLDDPLRRFLHRLTRI